MPGEFESVWDRVKNILSVFGIGTGSEPEPNRNRFTGSEPDPPNRFGTGKPETQEPVNR